MILGVLLACRDEPPVCPGPEGFDPEWVDEVRLSGAGAPWTAQDGATVDTAADTGCAEAPCLTIAGPGAARVTTVLNRGVDHSIRGTLSAPGDAFLTVRFSAESGAVYDLATVEVSAGSEPFDLPFTLEQPGSEVAVVIEVDGEGATLDGFALTERTWAEVDVEPGARISLGFLLHVEQDGKLESDAAHWASRAAIVEGFSAMLAAHGARLGFQPDVTFVNGAMAFSPDWMAAREAEGAGFSTHIHAEVNESGEAVERAVRDARASFRASNLDVNDLNGGFNTGQWSLVRDTGIRSLTAFKDPETQLGLATAFVQPWRPPDGATFLEPDTFMTHDPAGPLVYLPGAPIKEADPSRYADFVRRVLSQARTHAREGWVNTWYFVVHIDQFGPEDDDALALYLSDGSFAGDLAEYDRMLTEVTDPLEATEEVVYAVPADMARAWLEWEDGCLAP